MFFAHARIHTREHAPSPPPHTYTCAREDTTYTQAYTHICVRVRAAPAWPAPGVPRGRTAPPPLPGAAARPAQASAPGRPELLYVPPRRAHLRRQPPPEHCRP